MSKTKPGKMSPCVAECRREMTELVRPSRPSSADEFKREAVALLRSSGRPLMQIAGELGIQPSIVERQP
ncbi:MAG: hypothetical protein IPM60_02225 [Rhodospirillales bacterium]|nr:hypothetical protein [Rhodospirillales bacterium]